MTGGCPRRCSSCGSTFASDDGQLKKTICLQAQVALDKGLFGAAVSEHGYCLMKRLRGKPAPFLAVIEHDARANSGSASGDGPLKIVVRPNGDSLKTMACMWQRSLMSSIYLKEKRSGFDCPKEDKAESHTR